MGRSQIRSNSRKNRNLTFIFCVRVPLTKGKVPYKPTRQENNKGALPQVRISLCPNKQYQTRSRSKRQHQARARNKHERRSRRRSWRKGGSQNKRESAPYRILAQVLTLLRSGWGARVCNKEGETRVNKRSREWSSKGAGSKTLSE